MPKPSPAFGRRHLTGLLATLPLLGLGRGSRAQSAAIAFPDGARLLVAGPEGGDLEDLAHVLLPALLRGLPAETQLRATPVGGVDGVTGANQFATATQPDGYSALLVPGGAAMAWLAGDPRVHYDAGSWTGLVAAVAPAVLVSRVDPAGLRPGQHIRIGVTAPYGPDIAGALALHLMGLVPVPVPSPPPAGGTDPGFAAFAQLATDMIVLHGRNMPERLAAATAAGGVALCTLGALDAATGPVRDPAIPELPHLVEFAAGLGLGLRDDALLPAWPAVAAIARLGFALVLPDLAPAAMVTLWRRAADIAVAAAEPRAHLAAEGLRFVPGPATLACLGPNLGFTPRVRAAFVEWMGSQLAARRP